MYLDPQKFSTRRAELTNQKSQQSLHLEQGTITVKEKMSEVLCPTRTELEVVQALRRRALAFDLMNACPYNVMNRYHSELVAHMQEAPPPGYAQVTVTQLLRTDRAAWLHMAEHLTTLKPDAQGVKPLEEMLKTILSHPSVSFQLLPLPLHGPSSPTRQQDPQAPSTRASKRRRRAQSQAARAHNDEQPPVRVTTAQQAVHNPGKGGKSHDVGPTFPRRSSTRRFQTKEGQRICWAYNLPNGCANASAGQACPRGLHVCAEPGCAKAHSMQEHQ